MNKVSLGFGTIIMCLIGLGVWNVYLQRSISKTAFINTSGVFNDFSMKKELEKKFSMVESTKKNILDSLKMNLDKLSFSVQLSQGKDKQKLEELLSFRQHYQLKQSQFEEENRLLSVQYNEQIWKQLNQYIKEYGDKQNYIYIYGASGEGSLMYAAPSRDITKEVQVYVNERYQGGTK